MNNQALIHFWQSRTGREKIILSVGAGVVIIGLFYHVLLKPLQNKKEWLQNQIESDQQLLQWMQSVKQRVKGEQQPKTQGYANLFTLVEQKLRPFTNKDSDAKIEQSRNQQVTFSTQYVAFGDLIQAIFDLNQQYGVKINKCLISRIDDQGHVRATIIFSA